MKKLLLISVALLAASASAQEIACTKIGFEPGTPDPNKCTVVVSPPKKPRVPAKPAPRPVVIVETVVIDNSSQIEAARREAAVGIARSSAILPITPSRAGKTTLNLGVASYGGEKVWGLALAHRPTSALVVSGGFSDGKGRSRVVQVGVGVEF